MINKVILERNQTAAFMAYACKSARRWHLSAKGQKSLENFGANLEGYQKKFETTRENVT